LELIVSGTCDRLIMIEAGANEVPENIKKTFDRLGIPEAEKKSLA
jgi:Fe-S cluster assembly scaffold protein SufB